MSTRKAYAVGQPDHLGVQWLDHVQSIVSPAFIKAERISTGELLLTAKANARKDRCYRKKGCSTGTTVEHPKEK